MGVDIELGKGLQGPASIIMAQRRIETQGFQMSDGRLGRGNGGLPLFRMQFLRALEIPA